MEINQWRNVSRPLKVFGIPVMAFTVFVMFFPFPHVKTLVYCSCVLAFYGLLAWRGYTVTVLYERITGVLRGNKATGRPWWYRKTRRF